eukprot:gene16459-18091_t
MQGVKKAQKIGPIKGDNNEIITEDNLVAESLNSHFAKVGEKLAGEIRDPSEFTAKHHIHRDTPVISNISITEEKVKSALRKRTRPGKGSAHDNISSKDLHLIGDSASKGLNIVMRNSVEEAQYPTQWQISKVRAIPKKGNMLDRGNYRPVSLLSIPSKIYESIICDELGLHLKENNISNPHQWGFTKAKSTELLMLHLTEQWKAALDEGKYIGVLFIDFKKAFDSISHETLALKLQACGASSHLHKLIMRLIISLCK